MGGGGALFLRHQGNAFAGVLFDADFTGVASTLSLTQLDCQRNKVPLAPRFPNRKGSAAHRKLSGTSATKQK